MANILASTKSDIATISSIKSMKLDWLTVINQIETVTAATDRNFGKGLFETLGGVVYSGFEFDSKNNKIVLSGRVKTNDATNFTLLSNLIDDLERSEHFMDVDMRSFAKSGTKETGFTSNFSIDLNLEFDASSPKTKPIALGKKIARKARVKRIK